MAEAVTKNYPQEPQAIGVAGQKSLAIAKGWPLLLLVFVGGISSMSLEMAASRLLAPYFGTSLFIWAILIGMVMIYLSVGYWFGGRLADRFPAVEILCSIMAVAGFFIGIIPVLAQPVLTWSLEGFSEISVGIFLGSLLGVILLFAVPVVLLGVVSPFAIRLRMARADAAGHTAGSLYSLSTVGSILGTLVPTFFLIPDFGTAATLYITSVVLMAGALVIMLLTGKIRFIALAAVAIVVVLGLAFFAPHSLIKPPPYGKLITEKDSAYNYIQVVQTDSGDINLVLNEGHAVHSVYKADPNALTGGPWDYWLVAPYFNANYQPTDLKNMAMLGSAAGTASQLVTKAYGPIPIDNVELDPAIVDLAHQYFHLNEPNINNIISDARYYLRTTSKQYSLIGIDAYRQPYIPFHLTTVEFFQEVREHLSPNGVVMINAGRAGSDFRLVDAVSATMREAFSHVYVIDVATMGNSMIVGTNMDNTSIQNFKDNAATFNKPWISQVMQASITAGNMREVQPASVTGQTVFTDDKAPIENLIDNLILGYIGDQ